MYVVEKLKYVKGWLGLQVVDKIKFKHEDHALYHAKWLNENTEFKSRVYKE